MAIEGENNSYFDVKSSTLLTIEKWLYVGNFSLILQTNSALDYLNPRLNVQKCFYYINQTMNLTEHFLLD